MRNDIIIIIQSFNEKLRYKCLYLFFNINPLINTHLTNDRIHLKLEKSKLTKTEELLKNMEGDKNLTKCK